MEENNLSSNSLARKMYAIFDPCQHAPSMTKLFPDSDYFTYHTYREYHPTKEEFISTYGFEYKEDISKINSINYRNLIIIFPTFDNFKNIATDNERLTYNLILGMIRQTGFDKILYFDNYDFDYDLKDYLPLDTPNLYVFKRCYNKTQKYSKNVFSFPFLIWGRPKDIMWRFIESHDSYKDKVVDRVDKIYWSGSLFIHNNELGYQIYCNRYDNYNMISEDVENVPVPANEFINKLSTYKFGADMSGLGNPNCRTLELLISRALIIQQKNELQWPFEDGFLVPPELQYNSKEEFKRILSDLKQNSEKYNYYISEQNRKFDTYFTIDWLRDYIYSIIFEKK